MPFIKKKKEPTKAAIQLLLPGTLAQDIYSTFVELDIVDINVKQKSSKKISLGGGNDLLDFLLFLVTMQRKKDIVPCHNHSGVTQVSEGPETVLPQSTILPYLAKFQQPLRCLPHYEIWVDSACNDYHDCLLGEKAAGAKD